MRPHEVPSAKTTVIGGTSTKREVTNKHEAPLKFEATTEETPSKVPAAKKVDASDSHVLANTSHVSEKVSASQSVLAGVSTKIPSGSQETDASLEREDTQRSDPRSGKRVEMTWRKSRLPQNGFFSHLFVFLLCFGVVSVLVPVNVFFSCNFCSLHVGSLVSLI